MAVPRRSRIPALLPAIALTLALVVGCADALAPDRTGSSPPDAERASGRLDGTRVLAISVDGLSVRALRKLGRERTPNLHRLLRQGAGTRNARAQVEQTVTLPNHTSMLTGRRIDPDHNGHGVTWNTHRPGTTVHRAAGERVSSIFGVVHRAGGGTALFATERKLSIFQRSWPSAIDRTVIVQDGDVAVARRVRRDLVRRERAFTLLHFGKPDEVGHEHRWMSRPYLRAVMRVDALIGDIRRTIRTHPSLADLVIVLTADHGGVPGTTSHSDQTRLDNYRVPLVIWGPGVEHGDLYAMNPAYADPGRRRAGFRGTQPVRNGDLANLSADLLGLGPVPGSRWDRRQALTWR